MYICIYEICTTYTRVSQVPSNSVLFLSRRVTCSLKEVSCYFWSTRNSSSVHARRRLYIGHCKSICVYDLLRFQFFVHKILRIAKQYIFSAVYKLSSLRLAFYNLSSLRLAFVFENSVFLVQISN